MFTSWSQQNKYWAKENTAKSSRKNNKEIKKNGEKTYSILIQIRNSLVHCNGAYKYQSWWLSIIL